MPIIDEIMKEYNLQTDDDNEEESVQLLQNISEDQGDDEPNEIIHKLTELIKDLNDGKINIDDVKINISTISKKGIKNSIKYKGINRRWFKWGS